MLSGRRLTLLGIGAVLAALVTGLILLAPASAQRPADDAILLVEGSVTTADNRAFGLSGTFKVEVADITAGEFVLIGAFTGSVSDAAAALSEYKLVAPVLGSGPDDRCEILYIDPANLFTDALHIRPESSDVVLRLSPAAASDELISSLCHLARAVDDAGAGSLDEAVFAVNDLLR